MKIVVYILSLYILVLTVIPCVDEPKDHIVPAAELTQNSSGNHHNDTNHCSPFCICACCTTSIFYQAFTIQFSCFSMVQKYIPATHSVNISSLLTVIWQPPKVG